LDAEVVVVGAGPGGSSAAYHLAHLGRDVLLLDKASFPRDKSCGDGVTRAGACLLKEMGVLDRFKNAQEIRGARVFMRNRGVREFLYPPGLAEPDHGLVVPRFELDHALCRHAVSAGARLWEDCQATHLIWEGDKVCGVEVLRGGERQDLHARVIIAADGAASRLARQAGLQSIAAEETGFALRGYYEPIRGLTDLLEIYMPLMDPTDRLVLPSYGWVFPTGSGRANIGVGLFQRFPGVNLRELFGRFLDQLKRSDERFSEAELIGSWRGAPLRFDFEPHRCSVNGLALVGDAAGLISPFTGEGISYALESGKMAAETIHGGLLSRPGETPDLSDYARRLSSSYVGYFETGRQSARRYQLMWHVLDNTFQNEKPVYVMARQAALFPEGVGQSYANAVMKDVSVQVEDEALPLRPDLLAISEILIETVRRDWPFLARVASVEQLAPGIPFRPSLLILLSGYTGQPSRPALVRLGAAVDLGYLAALAQVSVEEESSTNGKNDSKPANWGNMFALMVSDFLLSKAFMLSAQVASTASQEIARSLARAVEGQVREMRNAFDPNLSPQEYLETVKLKIATIFQLPCVLGARLGGSGPLTNKNLSGYGQNLGVAYQLMEETRLVLGYESSYGGAATSRVQDGVYSLPLLLAVRNPVVGSKIYRLLDKPDINPEWLAEVVNLARESGAASETLEIARSYVSKAQKVLEQLPVGPARQSLHRLADYVVQLE
jgi:geranylgeranyl reductase family protein